LGQGRGGFYSYDFLENLVGCDIHSADRIVPEWQDVGVGDEVRFAQGVGLAMASLERGRSLVLRGGVAVGKTAPPDDFTWAFELRDQPDETTRLLVRERYAYTRPWARLIVEPTEVLSFVMSEKMLRGSKTGPSVLPATSARPVSERRDQDDVEGFAECSPSTRSPRTGGRSSSSSYSGLTLVRTTINTARSCVRTRGSR